MARVTPRAARPCAAMADWSAELAVLRVARSVALLVAQVALAVAQAVRWAQRPVLQVALSQAALVPSEG